MTKTAAVKLRSHFSATKSRLQELTNSATRGREIRAAEIVIRPAPGLPAQTGLRNGPYTNHNDFMRTKSGINYGIHGDAGNQWLPDCMDRLFALAMWSGGALGFGRIDHSVGHLEQQPLECV